MARLNPFAVYELVRSVRATGDEPAWLAVGGHAETAERVADALAAGARSGSVRIAPPAGATAFVLALAAPPGDADERALRAAKRERVPVVCLLADPALEPRVPYVLATDVVRATRRGELQLDELVARIAYRAGDAGAHLAARAPVLREAVCAALVRRHARRNGLLGAAVFVPGADLPVLTLNQLRLVILLGAAHGIVVDQQRLPEILAVVGSGLALRAAARQTLGAVPVAGWAVKGGIAYAGTRALGEAATRYFAARAAAGA